MALVVEEERGRIGDRGWILIEDRTAGAGARRVDDAVRRRVLAVLRWLERQPAAERRVLADSPPIAPEFAA